MSVLEVNAAIFDVAGRRFGAGDVVGHRHAWELDDAALDGVHQREVAHRPGEQRAFGVARAAQEEWRGGEIEDGGCQGLPVALGGC